MPPTEHSWFTVWKHNWSYAKVPPSTSIHQSKKLLMLYSEQESDGTVLTVTMQAWQRALWSISLSILTIFFNVKPPHSKASAKFYKFHWQGPHLVWCRAWAKFSIRRRWNQVHAVGQVLLVKISKCWSVPGALETGCKQFDTHLLWGIMCVSEQQHAHTHCIELRYASSAATSSPLWAEYLEM